MLLTAELRLWWRRCPGQVESLFSGCRCEARSDIYLLDPDQPDVGIKLRGGQGAEIKLLVVYGGPTTLGRTEMWVKSSSTLKLVGVPTAEVRKIRRTRLFSTSLDEVHDRSRDAAGARTQLKDGCSVEFTRVERDDEPDPWWTLGFEAFGALEDVERILGRTVEHVSKELPADWVAQSFCASYPSWLCGFRGN